MGMSVLYPIGVKLRMVEFEKRVTRRPFCEKIERTH
jgi:hypothetical protein